MSFDLDNLLGLLFFVVFIVLPLFSRGKKKGQQPQQGKSAAGEQPRAPVAPTRQASTTAPRAPLSGQPTASADRGGSMTITLEEIARRVQEAQMRESASSGGAGLPPAPTGPVAPPPRRGLVASDPFEGSLVSSSGPPRTTLGREGSAPAPGQQRMSVLGREGGAPDPRAHTSVLGREGMGPQPPQPRSGRSHASLLGREGPQTGMEPSLRQLKDKTARAAAAVIGENEDSRRRSGVLGATLSPVGPLRLDRAGIMHGLIWHEVLDEPPSLKRLRRSRSRLH